jgi:hypothetical protein
MICCVFQTVSVNATLRDVSMVEYRSLPVEDAVESRHGLHYAEEVCERRRLSLLPVVEG